MVDVHAGSRSGRICPHKTKRAPYITVAIERGLPNGLADLGILPRGFSIRVVSDSFSVNVSVLFSILLRGVGETSSIIQCAAEMRGRQVPRKSANGWGITTMSKYAIHPNTPEAAVPTTRLRSFIDANGLDHRRHKETMPNPTAMAETASRTTPSVKRCASTPRNEANPPMVIKAL
ncbi:hypothetical protein SDC9_155870 [bioreactor metagenome]|uniref:Uncharacterized protein n=1 Tax=bioreactor metagenome TaxID=1076179 RepID=A0A645F2Y5_9ZZZZ